MTAMFLQRPRQRGNNVAWIAQVNDFERRFGGLVGGAD
jgi:hypothetical protein